MIKAKRFGHVTLETSDLERQIAYFTEVAGLVLAERENGRAYLATKLGDLVVQLESGEHACCRRLAFQVAPETRLQRHPQRHRGGRSALSVTQRSGPGHCANAVIRGSQRHGLRSFRCTNADLQTASRRRHRTDQAWPSGLCRSGAEAICRLLWPGSRLPRLGLDRGLVRLHALRSGPPHHQLRARQAHADAPCCF